MKICPECGRFYEDADFQRCPQDGAELEVVVSEDAKDPLIGQVLDGRFEIVDKLGEGGMGTVYRGIQTSVEREVAVKVIRSDVTVDLAKRFMLEARATSKLRNPHTVTIFDFGRVGDGMLYLAMELLVGQPLDEALAAERRLGWRRALEITAQVAESLEEAHGKDLAHRDLKPANIFLTRTGGADFVKVLDFGVAKVLGEGTTNLTGTGMIIGTPQYMAPEQARAEDIDHRIDLYALGVVLYEMLAGQPPFSGTSHVSVLMKHCQDPVPPLDESVPPIEMPPGVWQLVLWMMAKKRDQRPQTARAVTEEARRLLREGGAVRAIQEVDQHAPTDRAAALERQETTRRKAAAPALLQTRAEPTPAVGPLGDTMAEAPSKKKGWFGAIAAAAVLLVGAGGWALTQDGQPAAEAAPTTLAAAAAPEETEPQPVAEPEPEPEPEPGAVVAEPEPEPEPEPPARVTVSSVPEGAQVRSASGEILGVTPLEMDAPANPLAFTLRLEGHADATLTLQPGGDSPAPIALAAVPEPVAAPAPAPKPKPAASKPKPRKRPVASKSAAKPKSVLEGLTIRRSPKDKKSAAPTPPK